MFLCDATEYASWKPNLNPKVEPVITKRNKKPSDVVGGKRGSQFIRLLVFVVGLLMVKRKAQLAETVNCIGLLTVWSLLVPAK